MKKESQLNIGIYHCSISDVGLEIFSNEMSKGIDEETPGNLYLTLGKNPIITDRANRSITTLLSRCKIKYFSFISCKLPGTVSTTLKCIINGLNYSSLKCLTLTGSHIYSSHVHFLYACVICVI